MNFCYLLSYFLFVTFLSANFRLNVHYQSLMCLPGLSDSRSITLAFSQSITWFSSQTRSVIGYIRVIYIVFVSTLLNFLQSQEISFECHPWNDLQCVEWDVKLLTSITIKRSNKNVLPAPIIQLNAVSLYHIT